MAPDFKMAANFSLQEVLEMVARDEEMDVDVQEVANEVRVTRKGLQGALPSHPCPLVPTERQKQFLFHH